MEMVELERLKAKAEVTGQIGEGLDGALVGHLNETHRLAGRSEGMRQAADLVLKMHEHIRKDLDEGVIQDGMSAVQAADMAMKWITRTAEALSNAAERAKLEEIACHGKVTGIRLAIEVTQRAHNAACARAAQETAAIEEAASGVEPEPKSVRPSKLDTRRVAARRVRAV